MLCFEDLNLQLRSQHLTLLNTSQLIQDSEHCMISTLTQYCSVAILETNAIKEKVLEFLKIGTVSHNFFRK
jgi:hypothetical protein